jgi:hypothetical protein
LVNYSTYFKAEQQAKVIFSLANGRKQGFEGQVRNLKNDQLSLELFGAPIDDIQLVEAGSEVSISTLTGWSMCRCNAIVLQELLNRLVILKLVGPVSEKQTRENFRLDIALPLLYSIPGSQNLTKLQIEWVAQCKAMLALPPPVMKPSVAGYKVSKWNKLEIEPKQLNLSADGIRFKTSESLEPRSLVAIHLFLPIPAPKTIHVVAEVLRCNEILLSRTRGNNFNVAMRFRLIQGKDRETVVAYINEEQRRMLRVRAGIEPQYARINLTDE